MLINDVKARESILVKVNGQVIPDPHFQKRHQSLRGAWHIAEFWPKIIRKNLAARKQYEAAKKMEKIPESKWVSRIYFNLGRHRYLPEYVKHTLHESVVLRLQGMATYKPKNVIKICGDIKSIPDKFQIEKWVHL
jgi:hypothetical protein